MIDINNEADMLKEWVGQAYDAGSDPKCSRAIVDFIAHDIATHFLSKVIRILEEQEEIEYQPPEKFLPEP